jgi:hypothetical protein
MQQCIKNKLKKACGIEINIIPLQNKIRKYGINNLGVCYRSSFRGYLVSPFRLDK